MNVLVVMAVMAGHASDFALGAKGKIGRLNLRVGNPHGVGNWAIVVASQALCVNCGNHSVRGWARPDQGGLGRRVA